MAQRSLGSVLRAPSAGGVLLLLGAVVGLVWVNSPWASSYHALSDFTVGPASLNLDLSIAAWAKDGLLAIFFFVVGLELKHELVAGSLRRRTTAIVPMVAALGGMAVPATIYLATNLTQEGGLGAGWAVPTATDIAFAVAVLSVVGRWLPVALRAFMLTLAVVDDLLAITIIALFFTDHLSIGWLAAAMGGILIFGVLVRRGITHWWVLLPLGVLTWAFMYASGVHATVAGVALGLTVPAATRAGEWQSLAKRWEHTWRPLSGGFAVPIFALFAAGVPISLDVIDDAVHDPVAQGIYLGLVVGKPLGIALLTAIVVKLTSATLDRSLSWWDVTAVSFLAGIGFTVSLLIGELSFGQARVDEVKMAVLFASTTAAIIGASLLSWRNRHYRRLADAEVTTSP